VGFKKKFGEEIGIAVEIFGQDTETKFDHLHERKKNVILSNAKDLGDYKDSSALPQNDNTKKLVASGQQLTAENVIQLIQFLNTDATCV